MKTLMAFVIVLCSFFVVNAQEETKGKLMADRWRGLIIDESTPDDAINALGKPNKDKKGNVHTYPLNSQVAFNRDTKGLRKLEYKKLEGIKQVTLLFKDDKLVLIELQYKKKIIASAFPDLYKINFTTEISDAFFGKCVKKNEGQESKKSYLPFYFLIGTTDKTYVSAAVENSSMRSYRLDPVGSGKVKDDNKESFPGKASRIQIIRRKTEKSEEVATLSNSSKPSPN